MTEDRAEHLAQHDPEVLIAELEAATMTVHELTFAAEIAGRRIVTSPRLVTALLKLLDHTNSVVREGAIYGLSYHLGASGVRAWLGVVAARDPSPSVRSAALEALEP